MSYDFSGKVVLITGSSSGIGEQTAVQFAQCGAKVVVTGRNPQNVSRVAEQCRQISVDDSIPLKVVADVTKQEDLECLVDETIKHFGRLDVLVNNAGYVEICPMDDPGYMSAIERVIITNLTSVVRLTTLCSEHLAKTKGNVVNISSVAGTIAVPKHNTSYSMSKCALDMFTKCAAIEFGRRGIRVNSVSPGFVKTHMIENAGLSKGISDAIFEGWGKRYPIGRYGQPEEVANAILFLASDKSSFITGHNMFVDGGHIAASVSYTEVEL